MNRFQIKDMGLPSDLDAAFTDDNGDDIYIKKNQAFRKEYGVYKLFLVQEFFQCTHDYYQRIQIPEINTWNKFKTDIYKYEIKSIPISPETIPDKSFGTTSSEMETPFDTHETSESTEESVPKEGFKIELWHIIVCEFNNFYYSLYYMFYPKFYYLINTMIVVIVVFILMAIICIAVFYWFGFCIDRKSEDSRDQMEIKKELFRKKLSKQKELLRQIHLK